jgi:hypothetical protein
MKTYFIDPSCGWNLLLFGSTSGESMSDPERIRLSDLEHTVLMMVEGMT